MIGQALNNLAGRLMRDFEKIVLRDRPLENVAIGEGLEGRQYLESVEDALTRIDAKAGAVLTHISMMVAAGAFVFSAGRIHWLEKIAIGCEIVAYLFLALCCLRCLLYRDVLSENMKLQGMGPDAYRAKVRIEVVKSGLILNFAVRWTFFITFIFAISLTFQLVF